MCTIALMENDKYNVHVCHTRGVNPACTQDALNLMASVKFSTSARCCVVYVRRTPHKHDTLLVSTLARSWHCDSSLRMRDVNRKATAHCTKT